MLKKILSNFLILSILIGFFPINLVSATFDLTTFKINNATESNIYFNPWDTFSIDTETTNTIWENIQNLRFLIDFTNNSYLNYTGTDQRTKVNSTTIINPVPWSDYSSSTWLNTPITSNIVLPNDLLNFSRTGNSFSAFQILNSISSYSNTITVKFDAEKVSDSSAVLWTSSSKTIYVNVKPHIISKYFEKSGITTTTIKWNWAEAVDLFVKVKDYNGCANIDNSNVTADLSLLGLSSNESLIYDSCEGDGKTAKFKKSWITTLASLWTKVFNHTDFSFSDEDGNSIDPNDSNFSETWETNSVSITVESPWAPDITNLGIVDDYIWGPWTTLR